mgnify:CR=1 FL=1
MNFITIPKEFIKEKELVLIPRRELEKLVRLAKKGFGEVTMTAGQKKSLQKARKNRLAGNFLTLNETEAKLGITS